MRNIPETCSAYAFHEILIFWGGAVMSYLYADHRRVLLIDENDRTRNLRATVFRNCEVEVHTAANFSEAAVLWKTIPYDFVLLSAREDAARASLMAARIRESRPRQRIGLLVGRPAFVQEISRSTAKSKILDMQPPFDPGASISASNPSEDVSPQWKETIHRVVPHWYDEQAARLGLRQASNRSFSTLS